MTVAKLRANQVFVIGEASAPGSYQVSSVGTMLTALYAGEHIVVAIENNSIVVRPLPARTSNQPVAAQAAVATP